MKKIACLIAVVAAISAVQADDLMKTATYEVFPGNWNKALINDTNLGKHIDPDLDRTTNKRKGLLTDGKVFQRAVCYNYHWTPQDQRFVTVVVDLGAPRDVEKVTIGVTQNNDGYTPDKYSVETSNDNVAYTALGEGSTWNKKTYERHAEVVPAAAAKCRYIRVKVWAKSAWINLTEIGVSGK